MATGGRAANLIALLKIFRELWPYIKEIIDIFKGMSPASQQAVLSMVSDIADLEPAERMQVLEQLRDTVASTNPPQG